ncbi:hypothetical protein D3C72_975010 [compost metagenome]
MLRLFGTAPITMGLSGSPPSRNITSTSLPMRGMLTWPYCEPAHGVATRTQQDILLKRSHGNCTRTRPKRSGHTVWPSGPTTVALCGPVTTGHGMLSAGRKTSWVG